VEGGVAAEIAAVDERGRAVFEQESAYIRRYSGKVKWNIALVIGMVKNGAMLEQKTADFKRPGVGGVMERRSSKRIDGVYISAVGDRLSCVHWVGLPTGFEEPTCRRLVGHTAVPVILVTIVFIWIL
jgi:hypothetical protein